MPYHYEDSGRMPTSLEDARTIIEDLRAELARRPDCIIVRRSRSADIAADASSRRLIRPPEETQITIIDGGCTYVYHVCVLVESPDAVYDTKSVRDKVGNLFWVPSTSKTEFPAPENL